MKLDGDVPCNGCTRCCHNDAVRILPNEDHGQWLTVPHDRFWGHRMLAHKANGDCVYLGDKGCTIHDQPRPQLCVEMDCRIVALRMSYTQARKMRVIRVWERGRELVRESLK